MPKYAHLEAELHCPFCDAVVNSLITSGLVWFQWGFCRAATPFWPESMYRIGDAIRWKACGDEAPQPWTYFMSEKGNDVGLNAGEPSCRDLIVLDPFQFQWTYKHADDPTKKPPSCETCGQPLHGAAVEIRDGIIRRAWIYKPGEFSDDLHIYLVRDDDFFQPMPEWENYGGGKMIPDCSPSRLVTIHELQQK